MGLDGTWEALNGIRWNMGGTEWDQMEQERHWMGLDRTWEALDGIRWNKGGTELDYMEHGRH